MAEPPVEDPYAEARQRADQALKSGPLRSFYVAATSWFGAMVASGTVVGALIPAQVMGKETGVAILITTASLAFPLVYGALEITRLLERSEALKDLFRAQKQWESLVRDAREERDELRLKASQLEFIVTAQQITGKLPRPSSRKALEGTRGQK